MCQVARGVGMQLYRRVAKWLQQRVEFFGAIVRGDALPDQREYIDLSLEIGVFAEAMLPTSNLNQAAAQAEKRPQFSGTLQ